MKKIFSENLFVIVFILFIGFGLLGKCTNVLNGIPKEKEELVKNIVLSKYPNFEVEVQKQIKDKKPTYVGAYGYKFEKTEQENVLIVKYGVQGVDWVEFINPFNKSSTTDISISVRVDIRNNSVAVVNCIPSESWWSSQKNVCY